MNVKAETLTPPTSLSSEPYPEFLRMLLKERGLVSKEEIDRFLNPDYVRDTHEPTFLKNIQKAAERIWQAVDKKEKILIFSDYDADGICSAAILSNFFKSLDYPVGVYMPVRQNEGHGLSAQ